MIPYSRVNCLKTIPFIAAHTYIAHIWQYPPGPYQLVVPSWTTFIAYTVGKFFLLIGASWFSRSLRLRGSFFVLFQLFGGWEGERTWALIWVSVGVGRKWGGNGRLFEAGRLLTFSALKMGGYSRWALIRINTVFYCVLEISMYTYILCNFYISLSDYFVLTGH